MISAKKASIYTLAVFTTVTFLYLVLPGLGTVFKLKFLQTNPFFTILLLLALSVCYVALAHHVGRKAYHQVRNKLSQLELGNFVLGTVGSIVGALVGALVTWPVSRLPFPYTWVASPAIVILTTLAGIWAFVVKKSSFLTWYQSLPLFETKSSLSQHIDKQQQKYHRPIILDTSSIIDGRIAQILGSGFMDGDIIVPNFVIEELQHIADATNSDKRARGRRGFEALKNIKSLKGHKFKVLDWQENRQEAVDLRLVRLAKQLKGRIATTDYNLNGVAKVQGVSVLNINELASILRPTISPGHEIELIVQQPGREVGQGIGYLEDAKPSRS